MASISDSKDNNFFRITNILINAGFSVNILKTDSEVIWRKLVRLSAISTLTSFTSLPLGKVRDNLDFNILLKNVVYELCSIAKTQQFIVNADIILQQIDNLPDRLTTSMQRDFQYNKKSEIEEILGNPIRLGKAAGLNLPNLEKCYLSLVKHDKIQL